MPHLKATIDVVAPGKTSERVPTDKQAQKTIDDIIGQLDKRTQENYHHDFNDYTNTSFFKKYVLNKLHSVRLTK